MKVVPFAHIFFFLVVVKITPQFVGGSNALTYVKVAIYSLEYTDVNI